MDTSVDHDQVAIGATYPDLEMTRWYSMLLLFSMEADGIKDYIMINKWLLSDQTEVNFLGVRAIALERANPLRMIAVMQTDRDATSLTFLNYNRDQAYGGLNLLQVQLAANLELSRPIIQLHNENQIWVQADTWNPLASEKKVFSLKLDIDPANMFTWEKSLLTTP